MRILISVLLCLILFGCSKECGIGLIKNINGDTHKFIIINSSEESSEVCPIEFIEISYDMNGHTSYRCDFRFIIHNERIVYTYPDKIILDVPIRDIL